MKKIKLILILVVCFLTAVFLWQYLNRYLFKPKATTDQVTVSYNPYSVTVAPGGETNIIINLVAKDQKKISGVDLVIRFNEENKDLLSKDLINYISFNQLPENYFNDVVNETVYDLQATGSATASKNLRLTLTAKKPDSQLASAVTINLKVKAGSAKGTTSLRLVTAESTIVGPIQNKAFEFSDVSDPISISVKDTVSDPYATGLVARYKMDEAAGTANVSDSSGNGKTGTSTSSTNITTGKFGNARSFNGTNDSISLGSSSLLRQAGKVSYAFWVKRADDVGRYIAGVGAAGGMGYGSIYMINNQIVFYWTPTSTNKDAGLIVQYNFAKDTWYHVAFVIDFAGRTSAVYVNGVLVANPTNAATNWAPVVSYNSGRTDYIGGNYINTTWYRFNGVLDEFAVWNRLLSASEVAVISNMTVTPITPTLTGTPGNVRLNLKLKFQGILTKPTGSLNSMKVKATIIKEGESSGVGSTGTFTANESGIWSGTIGFNLASVTGKYRILIKGPLHLQKKICDSVPSETRAGIYRCPDGNISLVIGDNSLNFSGIMLLGGDLDQNGIVDSIDFGLVKNNLGKTDLAILNKADLNKDGIVNTQDFSLILSALATRTDEQ